MWPVVSLRGAMGVPECCAVEATGMPPPSCLSCVKHVAREGRCWHMGQAELAIPGRAHWREFPSLGVAGGPDFGASPALFWPRGAAGRGGQSCAGSTWRRGGWHFLARTRRVLVVFWAVIAGLGMTLVLISDDRSTLPVIEDPSID